MYAVFVLVQVFVMILDTVIVKTIHKIVMVYVVEMLLKMNVESVEDMVFQMENVIVSIM